MPTLANQLVQFLMSLFNNPAAAQEFLNDPERALEGAGLRHVGSMDVDAVMPVVLDYAPITVPASSSSRVDNAGGITPWIGGATGNTPAPAVNTHLDDHAQAVQQLTHVVNNYSSASVVDDHDTTTGQSVHENIWAEDDMNQWFQNEAVIPSGDHALASGNDLNVHDSHNITDSFNTDNSLDASTDNSVSAGSVSAAAVSAGSVSADGDVAVGTSQLDGADSFNTDVDLDAADSFNNSPHTAVDNSDHSTTDVPVAIADSATDDHSSTDDHQTTTDAGIADSFHDDAAAATSDVSIADSFTPLEAEESYPDSHDTLDGHDSLDHSVDVDPDAHTVPPVDDSHIVL
jgi:hypothetical protein